MLKMTRRRIPPDHNSSARNLVERDPDADVRCGAASARRTMQPGISCACRVLIVVICSSFIRCSTATTEPDDSAPFNVENIAVYDGGWKDAGIGVTLGTGAAGVVNSIVQSPHNQNEILIAGAYDKARSGSVSSRCAGLALFAIAAGATALVEGDSNATSYAGGPYNSAEFLPGSVQQFFGGARGNASNGNPGGPAFGPIGRYDLATREWSKLDSIAFAGEVTSLARDGQDLYIGGYFASPFGLSNSANIVRYDIASRQAFTMDSRQSGGGATGVSTIEIDGGSVIVGGTFTSIGGANAVSIARWNGSAWEPLGTGLAGFVRDVVVTNGVVYAAGRFLRGDSVNICARFDGTKWTTLGEPAIASAATLKYEGHALAVYNGRVVMGGSFARIGDVTVNNIAMWDDALKKWNALEGGGVTNAADQTVAAAEVNSLVVVANRLYVGGRFNRARVQ